MFTMTKPKPFARYFLPIRMFTNTLYRSDVSEHCDVGEHMIV